MLAGIGKVDRYGPFIHSGLDRPNDELNAIVGHGVSPLSVEK
jgi:hypothetical protein